MYKLKDRIKEELADEKTVDRYFSMLEFLLGFTFTAAGIGSTIGSGLGPHTLLVATSPLIVDSVPRYRTGKGIVNYFRSRKPIEIPYYKE